jgi:aspartate carbamoyltransferase catalytic subunit
MLMPDDLLTPHSVDEAIEGADVVMMLRVQRERLDEDLGDAPGEYLESYGLTAERLARAAPGAVVMHPGPINRGIEIADAVADNAGCSLSELQVEYGVAARMACLAMLVA